MSIDPAVAGALIGGGIAAIGSLFVGITSRRLWRFSIAGLERPVARVAEDLTDQQRQETL